MLNHQNLTLIEHKRSVFEKHDLGKEIVIAWAVKQKLEFEKEVDISVGVADVIIYGDDIGIFEIGTTRPTKMLLLLKYIARQNTSYTLHFWPYGTDRSIVFKNWY
jgi:hypothetical protein